MKAFIPGIHCIGSILAAGVVCAGSTDDVRRGERASMVEEVSWANGCGSGESPGGEGQPPVSNRIGNEIIHAWRVVAGQ